MKEEYTLPALPKGITVYCASSEKIAGAYFEAARELGREIAAAGVPLINGAGARGLMGAVNDGCLRAGGTCVGVIPEFMVERGWHHKGLQHLIVTGSMHERKETMARLSRGAIALPGGIGTLDELCEILTWRQLGLYTGSVVLLNVEGYWDAFMAMLSEAEAKGFMRQFDGRLFTVASTPAEAVKMAMGNEE